MQYSALTRSQPASGMTESVDLPPVPPSRIGDFLEDERFGLVEVTGYTGGRIPWPIVGGRYTRGRRATIQCPPLTEALKLESVAAI